ncbi:sirohydrochlorin chelatase [Runella sp.]|uniref:sirohydrochlorin chelatase n=1 Tax=Runella sp. TaxID=1960881 RepID=UPI003D11BAC3
MKSIYYIIATLLLLAAFFSCQNNSGSSQTGETAGAGDKKIGVLLVNHGSRSETWRNELLRLEKNVTDSILHSGDVKGLKTAFMEYTEPSIATRLKEFDKEGFTDIVIIPVFLTVSPHTFEDIPTIIGQKEDPESKEMLKLEKIERYTPKAKTHVTPTLDFTNVLKNNVLKRVTALSKEPEKEGLVLIGYGDEKYEKEWIDLFNNVAEFVKEKVGIDQHTYGWCGHIAHYSSDKTSEAINAVLAKKEKAVVIPVLVAHDEMFQIKIIGGGIEKVKDSKSKVSYKPDSILPDTDIEKWVTDVAKEYVDKAKAEK